MDVTFDGDDDDFSPMLNLFMLRSCWKRPFGASAEDEADVAGEEDGDDD